MTLSCLLAVSGPAEGEQGKPTTNFTFRKKTPSAHPEQAVHPSTELRVNGASKDDPEEPVEPSVRPELVEGPVPISPAPPAVHLEPAPEPAPPVVRPEPIEPSVRPELVEGPVPISPAPPAVHPESVELSVHPELVPARGGSASGGEGPVPPPETVLITDEHSHPSASGLQSHAVDFPAPPAIPAHSMVVQEVWLDPQDPPRGIALQFKRADGEEAGVYWEGEEEVFNPAEHEELWYYGMLPELGKWVSLDILTEDIGLENSRIIMLRFVTFDGRALWRKTVLTDAPPLEGSKQTSPAALPAPSVSAPGSS